MKNIANNLLLTLLVIFSISSCSIPEPSGKTAAEVLYTESMEYMQDGRYMLAIEKLNVIRSKHPYSYYATHAELKLADIYFEQENYVEAASAYILFKDFHPKHKEIPYVIFRIAESYYNQMPSTYDRDLTPGYEAIRYYSELLQKYPRTEHTKGAIEKIKKCKSMIEKKQQYIADFYYKTGEFYSARFRYIDILQNFDEQKLVDHSIERVLISSIKLDEKDACKHYYKQLISKVSKAKKQKIESIYKQCK